jgi:hypothetical protein
VCKTGAYSCSTGTQTCVATATNVADGTSCGSSAVCSGGVCTPEYTLTLVHSGGGHIWTGDGKLECGSKCTGVYLAGTQVVVHATPEYYSPGITGSTCSGIAPCTITMNSNITLTSNMAEEYWYSGFTSGISGGASYSNPFTLSPYGSSSSYLTASSVTNLTTIKAEYALVNYQPTSEPATYYWEIYVNTGNPADDIGGIGIVDQNAVDTQWIGNSAEGLGFGYGYEYAAEWWNDFTNVTTPNGAPPSNSALTAGSYYMFAFNATTGNLWIGENGTWWNSGNPAAGTNPAATGFLNEPSSTNFYPAATLYGTADPNPYGPMVITLNWGESPWRGAPPFGF